MNQLAKRMVQPPRANFLPCSSLFHNSLQWCQHFRKATSCFFDDSLTWIIRIISEPRMFTAYVGFLQPELLQRLPDLSEQQTSLVGPFCLSWASKWAPTPMGTHTQGEEKTPQPALDTLFSRNTVQMPLFCERHQAWVHLLVLGGVLSTSRGPSPMDPPLHHHPTQHGIRVAYRVQN